MGLKATWSVGLVVGVALLLANNPRPGRPQLSYRRLLNVLPIILLAAASFAAIGAWIGSRGWLAWTSPDLRALLHDNLFRPHRFLAVHGMNLGGYAGGAIATLAAVFSVRRTRRRQRPGV